MDVYNTSLSIKSSLEFPIVAATIRDALTTQSFQGQPIFLLESTPMEYKFQVGSDGPKLGLWLTKTNGAVLKADRDYIDRAIGKMSENLVMGALMMWRISKVNKACAPLVAICRSAEAAVLSRDPSAQTAISDRIADFV